MIVNVKNENYGYSVATQGDWVASGNPSLLRYDALTASLYRTGSLDLFKYNTLTDQHDLVLTLYKPTNNGDYLVLSEETASGEIHTDIYTSRWVHDVALNYWSVQVEEDLPIQIDDTEYTLKLEDDYGHSVDIHKDVMVVGSRWHRQNITGSSITIQNSGSSVDVYNLSSVNYNPFDGFISTGSAFLVNVLSPPAGEAISGSFGHSVSINDEWIAVGSPNSGSFKGKVYVYRRGVVNDPNNFTWNYFGSITGSTTVTGDYFGHSIALNKASGIYSGSLVVGCGNKITTGSGVYFFEFNGTSWGESHIFNADRTLRYLPFYDVNPIPQTVDYTIDSFGNSVCLYKNTIGIGAPTDRWVYEYSGSRVYKEGAAYIFDRCCDGSVNWKLSKKIYGNDKTIKNNKLGFSVDIWDDKFIIGCPKSNAETMTFCYLQGSIFQDLYCYPDNENTLNGQWLLLQKNTSSNDWDTINVYQKRKKFLSPYKSFGYDIAIGDKSIVIGAPMIISSSVMRNFDIPYTSITRGDITLELDDITGKSYIYNLNNFRNEFHVGNVFYRNGKIILNTSGSVFDGMWFNPITDYSYQYNLQFDSKQTLYEKQFVCTVEPGEFNTSTNPSALVITTSSFDINNNGRFDWQDIDVILQYMQYNNTKYSSTGPTQDWSSSLLLTDEEVSYYNFYSQQNAYTNTQHDFISQSFFNIIDFIGKSEFDFNQDSKIDINDMNIFWKYCINRLNQLNYQEYITPNSKRNLFSDILDHLNKKTNKYKTSTIRPEFFEYSTLSRNDPTGSYLAPYVTTVGIYSGLDLIGTAKLATPIKLTGDYPVNFIIKMDF